MPRKFSELKSGGTRPPRPTDRRACACARVRVRARARACACACWLARFACIYVHIGGYMHACMPIYVRVM